MLLSNLKYLFLLFEKVKTYNKYMRTIQFREAICEAMSEEMRRDESYI
jgi:pyruvate dehydrogenase E1 component beta subunit